jgi:hypothetical protein
MVNVKTIMKRKLAAKGTKGHEKKTLNLSVPSCNFVAKKKEVRHVGITGGYKKVQQCTGG